MKILHVNTNADFGAIPTHISLLAREAVRRGHTVAVAKGRGEDMPEIRNIQIGSRKGILWHAALSRLTDSQGLHSRQATRRFIRDAENFGPDIIHLHNLHGYYLHYPTLFKWLKEYGRPVVWTLHDCWSFTGHCASVSGRGFECRKWRTCCSHCPRITTYPTSFFDRTHRNFALKRELFTSLPNLTLITPSRWHSGTVSQSFLSGLPIHTVPNDIDRSVFYPRNAVRKKRILGVAAYWTPLKGDDFFIRLRKELPDDFEIRLIGNIASRLPQGITALGQISDPAVLAEEYSQAMLFVNPTYAETFGMTNREAIACGTPIITRNVGGAVEGLENLEQCRSAETDDELLALVKQHISDNKHFIGKDFTPSGSQPVDASMPGVDMILEIYSRVSKLK